MSISVDVCLMSGKKVSLEVEAERSLGTGKGPKVWDKRPKSWKGTSRVWRSIWDLSAMLRQLSSANSTGS